MQSLLIQTVRVREVRVIERERLRLVVHHLHERVLGAADALRDRDSGVVPGGEQQPIEQIQKRKLHPRSEPHDRGARLFVERLAVDVGRDHRVDVRLVRRDGGGHELCEACGREASVRIASEDERSAGALDGGNVLRADEGKIVGFGR